MIKLIMKVVLCCLFFICIKLQAQLDTLQYLRTNFEIQKAEYIGKPFSYLLSKMTQIQPKTSWSVIKYNNISIITRTGFLFCEMDESFSDQPTLLIEWQTPLPATEVEYYEHKNGFFFTIDERNYYGTKIIKDIKVY